MTIFQQEQVQRMRSEDKSYSIIACCLGISENTIKSVAKAVKENLTVKIYFAIGKRV